MKSCITTIIYVNNERQKYLPTLLNNNVGIGNQQSEPNIAIELLSIIAQFSTDFDNSMSGQIIL